MKNMLDLRPYLTFLGRNKVYTAINVFGLSVSLAFVILIGLYASDEIKVDNIHSKSDRTYVMGYTIKDTGDKEYTGGHWGIQKHLNGHYPEIEKTCAVAAQNSTVELPSGVKFEVSELCADSTFYGIFDFKLLEGDPNRVLESSDAVVLTESFANKMFGKDDPLGKMIVVDGRHLKVTGLAADMKNSSVGKDCDMVDRFENIENRSMKGDGMNNASAAEIFILAKPGTDLSAKADDMRDYFRTFWWFYKMPDCAEKVLLVPFDKLYFSGTECSNGVTSRGNLTLLRILIAVGLLILIFSMMNYTNLTIAQSGYRAKEMATRRLLGSQRGDIFMKLIMESVFLCLLSMAIGIMFSWAACPFAGHLLDSPMSAKDMFSTSGLLSLLLISLATGIIAGIVPAVFISKAKPIEVVRGTFRLKTKTVFSKIFIVFQNIATISMIGIAITMFLQTQHLIHAPLGFNTDSIVEIGNPGDSTQKEAFINELKAQPCVSLVSCNRGTPKDGGNNNTTMLNGKTVSIQTLIGDQDFFRMYGLKLTRDNHIDDQNGVYVNQELLSELGLDKKSRTVQLTDSRWGGKPQPIRGIFENFHLRNILNRNVPIVIQIVDRKYMKSPWGFSILLNGDLVDGYNTVKSVFRKVYHQELEDEHPFVDQVIASEYESERKMSAIVGLFAGVAILISLLGLVAMSTYYIQQRSKEIAVRKVFGSTGRQVVVKLVRSFLVYVLLAFIVAVPIIWHFMGGWLSNYSYRIRLSPWIFIAAGLVTLVISFLAVLSQSIAAAESDPVDDIVEKE